MNKLMARIVAVVLAVMMLGTVSFAATTATKDAIVTDIATRDMYTVKATAGADIIAMYQGTDAPGTIAIDPNKVEVGETITVEYGGVAEGYLTQDIVINGVEDYEIQTTEAEVEVDGAVYTDVARATKKFVPGVGKTAKRVGFKLISSEGSAEGVDFGLDTTISGGGEVTFDVVILQIPVGVTITAKPYIEY